MGEIREQERRGTTEPALCFHRAGLVASPESERRLARCAFFGKLWCDPGKVEVCNCMTTADFSSRFSP